MAFKMALIQMHVAGGQKRRNLERACQLIAEAANNNAALVVLPEVLDLGWTHPSSKTEAEPVPGGFPCTMLAEAAAQYNILVCAGLTEADGNRVFNAAVILDRQGQILAKHRKLNELTIGHEFYDQGDRLQVAQTELGTLGLMICADGFAKNCVVGRTLGYMGADIVISPCAWAVDGNHDNEMEPYGDLWRGVYTPVAKEFAMWIIGVSNVGPIDSGPWAGRKCIGCSLVIGPDGEEVVMGPYGEDAETILYVDVQPRERPARGCGWMEK